MLAARQQTQGLSELLERLHSSDSIKDCRKWNCVLTMGQPQVARSNCIAIQNFPHVYLNCQARASASAADPCVPSEG